MKKEKKKDPDPEESVSEGAEELEAIAPAEETPEEGIARLESEISERDRLLEEARDRYLRALADLDNQRKRARQEKTEAQLSAVSGLLVELLAIQDNFMRALEAARKSDNFETLIEGVKLIHRQVGSLLDKRGVTSIAALFEPFDPTYHEAVKQVPTSEVEEGVVVHEFEKGYRLGNRVLRPAKVGVAVKPSEESNAA